MLKVCDESIREIDHVTEGNMKIMLISEEEDFGFNQTWLVALKLARNQLEWKLM